MLGVLRPTYIQGIDLLRSDIAGKQQLTIRTQIEFPRAIRHDPIQTREICQRLNLAIGLEFARPLDASAPWSCSKRPDGLGDDNSEANSLNNNGQVAGDSGVGVIESYNSDHALLWQNGKWADLNTLIPANSGYQLIVAFDINARGQIVVCAVEQSTGNIHAALLTPQLTEEQRIDLAKSSNAASTRSASTAAASPGIPFTAEDARRLLELARRAKLSR